MHITIDLLEKWGSCYTREQHEEIFAGRKYLTVDDVVAAPVPTQDKIWALLHEEIIPVRELRLLACDFAEDALKLVSEPDQRLLNAIAVSRSYAVGISSEMELKEASRAAVRVTEATEAAWAAVRAARVARAAAAEAVRVVREVSRARGFRRASTGARAWDAAVRAAGVLAAEAAWAAGEEMRSEQLKKILAVIDRLDR